MLKELEEKRKSAQKAFSRVVSELEERKDHIRALLDRLRKGEQLIAQVQKTGMHNDEPVSAETIQKWVDAWCELLEEFEQAATPYNELVYKKIRLEYELVILNLNENKEARDEWFNSIREEALKQVA